MPQSLSALVSKYPEDVIVNVRNDKKLICIGVQCSHGDRIAVRSKSVHLISHVPLKLYNQV